MKMNKHFSFSILEDRAKSDVLMRRTDTAAKLLKTPIKTEAAKLLKTPTLMELATKVSNLETKTIKMDQVCYM